MKHIKTIFLIIILVILLVIKFYPKENFKTEDNFNIANNQVITIDLSDIQTQKFHYLDKTSDDKYNLSLLYIVLYDDMSSSLVSGLESDFKNRLVLFGEFIKRESIGKIISESELLFINVKEFNSEILAYDRPIFDWIKLFNEKFEDEDYNIIVFTPIYEIPWCHDGLSQGFNYNGNIFFCMENFFNPKNSIENTGAVGLMTHKFLHGVGFNHQDQLYKQYQFLDWQMGLPETNILLHGNFRDFDHLFFDEHTLKVLGLINKTSFENSCLDKEEFICESTNSFFCKDSWGPFCQDVDKDGIIDKEDNYVFSSPVQGTDSDNDGIVDSLDLCDWNKISVSGNGITTGPLKIKALQNNVRISFSGEEVSISKIITTPFEMIGGFIKFKDEKSIKTKNNDITISNSESSMWRIEIVYNYDEEEYFRPYYLYFPNFDADFFYEKEWYYFNRFGCDILLEVEFSDITTYDENIDGLPNQDLISINSNYDWDNDSFSDLTDTLPTINGNCSNEFVKGVKDSDKDGFCDPGELDFSLKEFVDKHELSMKVDYNKFSDYCPYISGVIQGCP